MDVPPKWFWAHMRMIPQLQAEEALAEISMIAAGNGLMKEADQRRYLNDLRRAANGGRLPPSEKATAHGLAAIGIQVVTEAPSAAVAEALAESRK